MILHEVCRACSAGLGSSEDASRLNATVPLEAVLKAYALISHQIRGHHDTELGNFLHQDEHRNSTTYSDNAGLHDGQDQSAGLLQAKLLATSVLIQNGTDAPMDVKGLTAWLRVGP